MRLPIADKSPKCHKVPALIHGYARDFRGKMPNPGPGVTTAVQQPHNTRTIPSKALLACSLQAKQICQLGSPSAMSVPTNTIDL